MRTSLEFDVLGSTHSEIKQEAEKQVRSYLELDGKEDLSPYADIELKVETQQDKYIAHAHVRIK